MKPCLFFTGSTQGRVLANVATWAFTSGFVQSPFPHITATKSAFTIASPNRFQSRSWRKNYPEHTSHHRIRDGGCWMGLKTGPILLCVYLLNAYIVFIFHFKHFDTRGAATVSCLWIVYNWTVVCKVLLSFKCLSIHQVCPIRPSLSLVCGTCDCASPLWYPHPPPRTSVWPFERTWCMRNDGSPVTLLYMLTCILSLRYR